LLFVQLTLQALVTAGGLELDVYVQRQKERKPKQRADPSALSFAEEIIAKNGGRAAVMLRTERFKKQLSQKSVAQAAGIRASHLSAMERAVQRQEARRLAKVLKLRWQDLLINAGG
jgi:ribosome-binding protein aMBF1 (putative translation factor)